MKKFVISFTLFSIALFATGFSFGYLVATHNHIAELQKDKKILDGLQAKVDGILTNCVNQLQACRAKK